MNGGDGWIEMFFISRRRYSFKGLSGHYGPEACCRTFMEEYKLVVSPGKDYIASWLC